MATKVGVVESLANGRFYIKSSQGDIKELRVGDEVHDKDIVFGDAFNSDRAKVEISLDNAEVVVFSDGQKLLLDPSMVQIAMGTEELYFTIEDMELKLNEHQAIADLESDLRVKEWSEDDDMDILEEDTTEGDEELDDSEQPSGDFLDRDGAATGSESSLDEGAEFDRYERAKFIDRGGLIDAGDGRDTLTPRSQIYNEARNNQDLTKQNNKNLGVSLNPFETLKDKDTTANANSTRPHTDNPDSNTNRPSSEGPKEDFDNSDTPPLGGSTPTSEVVIKATIASVSSAIAAEGETLVHKVSFSNSSKMTTEVIVELMGGSTKGNATIGVDTGDVEFWLGGVKLNATKNSTSKYSVLIPANSDSFEIRVPTIDDDFYEGNEKYSISVEANNTKVFGTGIITDEDDKPILDPSNPNTPSPIEPVDSSNLPKDENDNPLIPGNFNGNSIDSTTGKVEVPEGNDALFKTTLSNPSSKDEIVKVIITTSNEDGKASDDDINRGDIKFYSNDGIELDFIKNLDGIYSVTLPKEHTEFYTVVPTIDDNIYEGDEEFTISVEINSTTSSAIGIITDEDDKPTASVLGISDAEGFEGDKLVHTIELKEANENYDLTIELADISATIGEDTGDIWYSIDGADFVKATLVDSKFTITDLPKDTQKVDIKVEAISDNKIEPTEEYIIKAYIGENSVNAKEATGTIKDPSILPGMQGGPNNADNKNIQGSDGDDIIVSDYGGVQSTLVPGMNYNIAFILDVSGSMAFDMDRNSGTDGERLKLLQDGLMQYIENVVIPFAQKAESGEGGYINLALIPFNGHKDYPVKNANGSSTTDVGPNSDKVSGAVLKLSIQDLKEGNLSAIEDAIKGTQNGLKAEGGTNYEASFKRTENWFKSLDNTDANGKIKEENEGEWTNLTFFITDGNPTNYMSGTSQAGTGSESQNQSEFNSILTNSKNTFDSGLSEISEVAAIGIGIGVKKSWLQLFDNRDEREITIDIGTPNISDGIVSGSSKPTESMIANFDNSTGNNDPSKWVSNDSLVSASRNNNKMVLKDAKQGDGVATVYTGPEFSVDSDKADKSFLSFEYGRENTYQKGDKFIWKLQQKIGDEWQTIELGGNAENDHAPAGNNKGFIFQTGILEQGTYRLQFELEDKSGTGNGNYSVNIDNIKLNTSAITTGKNGVDDTITGSGGNPDIVLNADEFQYALEAGGLFPSLLPVGNDVVYGGDGNDIIFGDTINTDWMEWQGRNLEAANSPDAKGSGMAAFNKYLDMLLENKAELPIGSNFIFNDSAKGVQTVDKYNFIKEHYVLFNVEGDTRGGKDELYGDGGDDIIFGQGGDDKLYGDEGNDILVGGAGADMLYGEAGDDILISDFHTTDTGIADGVDIVLDGGEGFDTLILEGNNNIDFSKLDSTTNPIKNIEAFDLSQGTHQLLNLTLQDVLDMTEHSEEIDLYILADSDDGDKVSFSDFDKAKWTIAETISEKVNSQGEIREFEVYVHSEDDSVKLKIETTIEVI